MLVHVVCCFGRYDPSQQGLQLPLQVSGTAAVVLFRDFNGLQVENPGGDMDGDVRQKLETHLFGVLPILYTRRLEVGGTVAFYLIFFLDHTYLLHKYFQQMFSSCPKKVRKTHGRQLK